MAAGIVIREAHFPGRAPIEAYGNGGFRFADMSHRGSILCLPSGIHGWEPADPSALGARRSSSACSPRPDEIEILLVGTGRELQAAAARAAQCAARGAASPPTRCRRAPPCAPTTCCSRRTAPSPRRLSPSTEQSAAEPADGRRCARPTATAISPRSMRRRKSAAALLGALRLQRRDRWRARPRSAQPLPGEIRLQWWRDDRPVRERGARATRGRGAVGAIRSARPAAPALRQTIWRPASSTSTTTRCRRSPISKAIAARPASVLIQLAALVLDPEGADPGRRSGRPCRRRAMR